tara:strand:+ start:149 stop:730 length:582 start_codon:yes stop_codon:yes gene_type:complete
MNQSTDPSMIKDNQIDPFEDLNADAFTDANQLASAQGNMPTSIVQPENNNSLMGVPRSAGADFSPTSIGVANNMFNTEQQRQMVMNPSSVPAIDPFSTKSAISMKSPLAHKKSHIGQNIKGHKHSTESRNSVIPNYIGGNPYTKTSIGPDTPKVPEGYPTARTEREQGVQDYLAKFDMEYKASGGNLYVPKKR